MGWDGLVDESIDVTTFIFYAIEIVREFLSSRRF